MITNLRGVSIARYLKAFSSQPELSKQAFTAYFDFVKWCYKHYGENTSVKILKEINSKCRHYAAGHPKSGNSFGGIWFRTNKKTGLPTRLADLSNFIVVEPNNALLIPNFVYTIYLEPNTDISTITNPEISRFTIEDVREWETYLQHNSTKLVLSKVDYPVITCKGGPNGPSAISQAKDLVAILLTTWPKGDFAELIKSTYGQDSWLQDIFYKFSKDVIETKELIHFKETQPSPLNAKLEFISSAGGKTRIVYILNWWAQMVLLPIHDSLMKSFRDMKEDATWDQQSAVDTIRKWSLERKKLYSFDLTAATDRWPIKHQARVVEHSFGKDVGETWSFIMSRIPPYVKHINKHVFYSTGQPMGAYSSWAVLNITHHYVIRFLAKKYRLPPLYKVLGDDVVIQGEELAKHYREYLYKLGVEINENKSLTHCEGLPHSAEFARHIVRDGNNVGCVSPNILETIDSGNWPMAIELIREVKAKLNLKVQVSKDTTRIPKQIVKYLSSKTLQLVVLALSIPGVNLKLPITKVDSISQSDLENTDEYVILDNPWKSKDNRSIQASLNILWMSEANKRMNLLSKLQDLLSEPGTSVPEGFLLSSHNHPIRATLSKLSEELAGQFWQIMRGEPAPLVPSIIQTDIDLLISILTKGWTYRKWRNSKMVKTNIIGGQIHKLWKNCPDTPPPPPAHTPGSAEALLAEEWKKAMGY